MAGGGGRSAGRVRQERWCRQSGSPLLAWTAGGRSLAVIDASVRSSLPASARVTFSCQLLQLVWLQMGMCQVFKSEKVILGPKRGNSYSISAPKSRLLLMLLVSGPPPQQHLQMWTNQDFKDTSLLSRMFVKTTSPTTRTPMQWCWWWTGLVLLHSQQASLWDHNIKCHSIDQQAWKGVSHLIFYSIHVFYPLITMSILIDTKQSLNGNIYHQ